MKKSNRHKLVAIVGPTASGKSELAVKIAKMSNGEVISADSRQIYRGLDIGTGKITKKEMADVPHYLLNVASPKRVFTVVQYQKLALKAIKDIWHRGKLPILCGGTGFYIQAVIDGITVPRVPPNPSLRKRLEELKTEELIALLRKKDLLRAKTIDIHNRRRLIRAIEIAHALGRVPALKKNHCRPKCLLSVLKHQRQNSKNALKNASDNGSGETF